ncbi:MULTISPECIES: metal-dependent transcriptional regulator [Deinococcus]|uniref:Manganese transport regulator n=1 Tax=Deinococcus arcticus TaxID=2136176 RepID=A0A2T3W4M8_9DEIO|nr:MULTISPECIES: metal-dependent transcriptional regulator [Deinococcus]MBZ9715871.1 metal-dependent transcriptional regulator [Deinococcus multiflagellatus]PTA66713.1 DtxR family transcriptional regulator [Deinococcus arcticus]
MPGHTFSPSVEDYLKQMYLLGQGGRVSTQALADAHGVNPASVTAMLRRLTERGLVRHVPYRGAHLTPAGVRAALNVLRRHTLLELYLHEALGYPMSDVHEEAERLEHVMSEGLEARVTAWLGHPVIDPHGDAIPGSDGHPATGSGLRLTDVPLATLARIIQLPHQPQAAQALQVHALRPGVRVTVRARCPGLGTLTVQAEGAGQPVVLAETVARRIGVTLT